MPDSGRFGTTELDALIDQAVAQYVAQEPLAGLEQRLIQRVCAAVVKRGTSPAGNRSAWLMRMASLSASVVAAVGSMFWLMSHRPLNPDAGPQVSVWRSPGPPVALLLKPLPATSHQATARSARGKKAGRQALAAELLPKGERFPTATPLTAEERALVAFVGHYLEQAQLFQESRDRSEEPLTIPALEIRPIEIDGTK